MSIQFNGVAVDSVYFNGSLLTEFVVNGINVLSTPTGFVLQFDGTVTTNAVTSKRELVNAGSGVPATLYGGQGIEGSTLLRVETGQIINQDTGAFFSVALEYTGVTGEYVGSADTGGARFYVGFRPDNIVIGTGSLLAVLPYPIEIGRMYVISVNMKNDNSYDLYINGGYVTSNSAYGDLSTTSFKLANYHAGGKYDPASLGHKGVSKDYLYIKGVTLSESEVIAHYNQPERTLYWEAGVLKSDLTSIAPAVIADMQAGDGFWYPLCENVNAVDNGILYAMDCSKYNAFSAVNGTPVEGTTSTTARTNAQQIEFGLQMPLLTSDAFGVPTGLASIDWQANTGSELVAEALAENNLNVVITGDDANPTAIDIYEA